MLRELWWACLDEELPSGLECRADSKTGWEGRTLGEMAHGEAVRVREAPRLQKCNFTSTLAHESNKYFFFSVAADIALRLGPNIGISE